MNKKMSLFLGIVSSFFIGIAGAVEPPLSEETEACLECHAEIHPGIVAAWEKSRHALVTTSQAKSVKISSRKVSSDTIPDSLRNVVVGCAECHTLAPDTHKDTVEHNDVNMHPVVTPNDCAVCHSQEAEQFDRNLMAYAHTNLTSNKVYELLVQSIIGKVTFDEGKVKHQPPTQSTQEESCLSCHGTRLKVTGLETRETDLGDMDFPVISGWPNQGIGRINPDGSRGACSGCHARHEFSIETARKPHTCKQCHTGPDVPAFKVYSASKHGNIYASKNKDWNFTAVPWTIGKDFTAPTCAACHMSHLVNHGGDTIVPRTHEIKDRLPWRIFGLIYAHPHPNEADTSIIKNKDGLQLPTSFEGEWAKGALLDGQERSEARTKMQASCRACHDTSWVTGNWNRLLDTIEQTNTATLTATQAMSRIWEESLAAGLASGGNPFDEYVEKIWSDVWLFHCNSIRFASAMGGGGDYGVFADGRYQLMKAIQELEDWWRLRRKGETATPRR